MYKETLYRGKNLFIISDKVLYRGVLIDFEEQYQVLKSLLIDILNHSTVIFVLIQHGYYENIYPLLRKTIETYVIYLTLKHSNMNVDHCMKFQYYKIVYECRYELDNVFVKLYENSQNKCSIQYNDLNKENKNMTVKEFFSVFGDIKNTAPCCLYQGYRNKLLNL